MTDAIKEAVELADKHGAEHRFEHNGTLEVFRFEPDQLAALIAEVRRQERVALGAQIDAALTRHKE